MWFCHHPLLVDTVRGVAHLPILPQQQPHSQVPIVIYAYANYAMWCVQNVHIIQAVVKCIQIEGTVSCTPSSPECTTQKYVANHNWLVSI